MTTANLTLDSVFDVAHREGFDLADHSDVFCRVLDTMDCKDHEHLSDWQNISIYTGGGFERAARE